MCVCVFLWTRVRLKDGRLTADELNSLIAHAHRRIEQLERRLEKQRTSERTHVEGVLGQQRQEHELLTEERLKQEREKMQDELGVIRQQRVCLR